MIDVRIQLASLYGLYHQKRVASDIKKNKQVDRYLFLCGQFIRRSLLYVVGLTLANKFRVCCVVCLNCQHFCVSLKKNEDESSAEYTRRQTPIHKVQIGKNKNKKVL